MTGLWTTGEALDTRPAEESVPSGWRGGGWSRTRSGKREDRTRAPRPRLVGRELLAPAVEDHGTAPCRPSAVGPGQADARVATPACLI